MADTGELPRTLNPGRCQVVRLPLLSDVDLPADATRFMHGRPLPPVPPARPRP